MPDEPQNPIPLESADMPSANPASNGTGSQEPTADAPILPMDSEPAEVPSEAPESPPNDLSVKSNDIPPSDSALILEEEIPLESTGPQANPVSNGTGPKESEPISEPVQAPGAGTAQMPVNEPFDETHDKPLPEPEPKTSLARQLLISARNAIQFRKRKKLDKIMSLFLQQSKVTNDEVEKFLHVSDATATRYLSILEKENKIKQVGKTGKGVSYTLK